MELISPEFALPGIQFERFVVLFLASRRGILTFTARQIYFPPQDCNLLDRSPCFPRVEKENLDALCMMRRAFGAR